MVYGFPNKKTHSERVVFAVSLDKQKMTERIVVGSEWQVYNAFQYSDGDVFCDVTRPIGSFLVDFVVDKDSDWRICQSDLLKKRSQLTLLHKAPAKEKKFLQDQYNTSDPVKMYAAFRLWDEFLLLCAGTHDKDSFNHRVSVLTRPFTHYIEKEPWRATAKELTSTSIFSEDSKSNLWYPNPKRPDECLIIYESFIPVFLYYLKRIEEWKLSFRSCRICGKTFLASSKHYDLCSATCRKEQRRINKREYDQRMAGKTYQALYDSACDRWYNKLRKAKKENAANPKKVAALEKAYKDFRTEAKAIKTEVARGKRPLTDLTGCIQKWEMDFAGNH